MPWSTPPAPTQFFGVATLERLIRKSNINEIPATGQLRRVLETQEMRHAISHDINNDEYWPAHDCLGPLGDSMSHLLDGILQFLNLLFLSSAHLSFPSLLLLPLRNRDRNKNKTARRPRWSKFDQPVSRRGRIQAPRPSQQVFFCVP